MATIFRPILRRPRVMPEQPMFLLAEKLPAEQTGLPLEEQVVRLQALLEASRRVHSTIHLNEVLHEAARIAVLELELEGAIFLAPDVSIGQLPEEGSAKWLACPRFELSTRAGELITELLVATPLGRALSLYELDFLEGLVLQTALAAENALHHQQNLEYARLAQDLEAARLIQQSLLPQRMPQIPEYTLAARSDACYQVGGDYLDILEEPGGTYLMAIADVAGKGLASALMCTAFRSAFRALARQGLPLEEMAAKLSQQHWEEGVEARRRYVTAFFARLDPAAAVLTCVNAGHNPSLLCLPDEAAPRRIEASGTPLGLLPGTLYAAEQVPFPARRTPAALHRRVDRSLSREEEFGTERLAALFRDCSAGGSEGVLSSIWHTLGEFTGNAPQGDDMTAMSLSHLASPAGEGSA